MEKKKTEKKTLWFQFSHRELRSFSQQRLDEGFLCLGGSPVPCKVTGPCLPVVPWGQIGAVIPAGMCLRVCLLLPCVSDAGRAQRAQRHPCPGSLAPLVIKGQSCWLHPEGGVLAGVFSQKAYSCGEQGMVGVGGSARCSQVKSGWNVSPGCPGKWSWEMQ